MNKHWITMAAALGVFTFNAGAWDYEGHRVVNQLALACAALRLASFVAHARHPSTTGNLFYPQ